MATSANRCRSAVHSQCSADQAAARERSARCGISGDVSAVSEDSRIGERGHCSIICASGRNQVLHASCNAALQDADGGVVGYTTDRSFHEERSCGNRRAAGMRCIARKRERCVASLGERVASGDVAGDDEIRRVGREGLVGAKGNIQPQGLRVGRVVHDTACANGQVAARKRVALRRVGGKGETADRGQIIVVCARSTETGELDRSSVDWQRVVQPVCVRGPCAIAGIPHEEGAVVKAQRRGVCGNGEHTHTVRSIEPAGVDGEFLRGESGDVAGEVRHLPFVAGGGRIEPATVERGGVDHNLIPAGGVDRETSGGADEIPIRARRAGCGAELPVVDRSAVEGEITDGDCAERVAGGNCATGVDGDGAKRTGAAECAAGVYGCGCICQ